jgi:hypothetical protein
VATTEKIRGLRKTTLRTLKTRTRREWRGCWEDEKEYEENEGEGEDGKDEEDKGSIKRMKRTETM